MSYSSFDHLPHLAPAMQIRIHLDQEISLAAQTLGSGFHGLDGDLYCKPAQIVAGTGVRRARSDPS